MTSTKKVISGAAIGTFLGSLAALLYQRRYEILEKVKDHSGDFTEFTDRAKEYGGSLLNKGKQLNFRRVEYRTNYWKGGLLGIIAGAGAALLLAPKTGKTLRGQITRAYNDFSEKTEDVIHQFANNSHNPLVSATHHNGIKKKKPTLKVKKTTQK